MGWGTRWYRKAKNWTTRNAGEIGRGAVVAGAGVAGSLVPGCGPACGFGAAALVDATLGGPVERTGRRVTDRAIGKAEDYFSDPLNKEAPPTLSTGPSGAPLTASARETIKMKGPYSAKFSPESRARLIAEAEEKEQTKTRNRAIAIGGGIVGLGIAAVVALRKR